MIERIVIETETPGDSRTMFRVRMDDLVIGQNLTAAQAHLIVGEVLDRITNKVGEMTVTSVRDKIATGSYIGSPAKVGFLARKKVPAQ